MTYFFVNEVDVVAEKLHSCYSGNVAKRIYRFKKPSEAGAYRKRQNPHEASLLVILTARNILKPRNGKKNFRLVWKYYICFLFTVLFKRKKEKSWKILVNN